MPKNDLFKENENIEVTIEDNIGFIKMNRPKAMNALNSKTLTELENVIGLFEKTDEVKGIIITGEGRAFVAGADIVEMKDYGSVEGRSYANFAQEVFNKVESIEKPVIAAVNGFALGGGCELAMSCDIRIASEKAVFGQPEVKLGLIPCFGGTQRLPRLVGEGRAKEIIYTCRNVKADEAFTIGLVNKVVSPEELLNEAKAMLQGILKMSPLAISYSKVAINKGKDMDLKNALELEKDLAAIAFGSDQKEEGISAFLEKREPNF